MTKYTMEQLMEVVADSARVEAMDVYCELGRNANSPEEWVEDDGILHLTRGAQRIAWDIDSDGRLTRYEYKQTVARVKDAVARADRTCAECHWVNTCKCGQPEPNEAASKEEREIAMYGQTAAAVRKQAEWAVGLVGKQTYAMGILSDAQELMAMGRYEEARQCINKAKLLMGDISELLHPANKARLLEAIDNPR